MPNLKTQEINRLINRIFEALREWDVWMDTQNPIPTTQKENILNYYSRMVTIKGKENQICQEK